MPQKLGQRVYYCPLEESLSGNLLATVLIRLKMHSASSDVQNCNVQEGSGVELKAASVFVRVDTAFQP
jgi:hypothetical protein